MLISEQVGSLVGENSLESLRSFCLRAGRASNTRITVVDSAGNVMADSSENPDSMDNHQNRPEIMAAMQGETGTSLRYSKTLGREMLYVAITFPAVAPEIEPERNRQAPIGVLRMSVPLTAIEQILTSVHLKIFMGVFPVICIAALVTLFISRRISRPLEKMQDTAELYSRIDFRQKMADNIGTSASSEVVALAGAMDHMAKQLSDRIKTIVEQRNELETVFAGMQEAVIAVDRQWRIVSLNNSAAEMFVIEKDQCQGKMLQEVIRNLELLRQVDDIMKSGRAREEELILEQEECLYLRTNGVPLLDSNGDNMGVLLVINDVTSLRRLENVRRDFVANVSHELKTPITSIKGYVETLLDGALDNRDDAKRFLAIVLKQSDRLNAIIEDLLDLSRLEEQTEKKEITLSCGRLKPVLAEVIEACQFKADEKNITLSLSCPEKLQLNMNETLLEQALTNLVINAIKYSDSNSRVWIKAEEDKTGPNRDVVISVADNGVGIAQEHLPRLFERFYRSDKARSRKLGGTGLGLAIVKHIAQAHNGTVEVISEVGRGTTFFLRLPA